MYHLKPQYMEVQVLIIISTVKGARRYASESKYLFVPYKMHPVRP